MKLIKKKKMLTLLIKMEYFGTKCLAVAIASKNRAVIETKSSRIFFAKSKCYGVLLCGL